MKIVISTDAHATVHLRNMKYGVITARRGWIEKKDVINTLPLKEFLAALRPKPSTKGQSPTKRRNPPDECGVTNIVLRNAS